MRVTDLRVFLSCMENCIRDGLMGEVCTTPKPGLVDLKDNGAHHDMDIHTFERSTDAITPYLVKMAETGCLFDGEITELFPLIRALGIEAEEAMLEATGGVNTHKGIIFTLGILVSAAGYRYGKYGCGKGKTTSLPPDSLTAMLTDARRMVTPHLRKDMSRMRKAAPVTHGEKIFRKYGIPGIRGEAMGGFPSLAYIAVPAMKKGLREQPDENAARLHVLLSLMASVDDTNILTRAGYSALCGVRTSARDFLEHYPVIDSGAVKRLEEMNREFIRRRISPGGCADLLAAAIFWEKYESRIPLLYPERIAILL